MVSCCQEPPGSRGGTGGGRPCLGEVAFTYDGRGDLRTEELVDATARHPLREHTFDDLGRPTQVTDYNVGVAPVPAAARAVVRDATYDSQSRLATEVTSIGGASSRGMAYRWSLRPDNTWKVEIDTPSGAGVHTQRHQFDGSGRLSGVERTGGAGTTRAEFSWRGERLAGRTQWLDGRASPIREEISLSGHGESRRRGYRLIDLDAQGAAPDPWRGDELQARLPRRPAGRPVPLPHEPVPGAQLRSTGSARVAGATTSPTPDSTAPSSTVSTPTESGALVSGTRPSCRRPLPSRPADAAPPPGHASSPRSIRWIPSSAQDKPPPAREILSVAEQGEGWGVPADWE